MASNASSLYDQMVMKIGASFEAEETVDDDDDDGPFGSASTSQVFIRIKCVVSFPIQLPYIECSYSLGKAPFKVPHSFKS